MIWFRADDHFYHNKVIAFCNRPFASLDEMHAHMIAEHNKRVNKKDHVYFLGDFSFSGTTKTTDILSKMNGYKILIKGNHDMAAHKMIACGFNEVHENIHFMLPGGQTVFLSHFPYHPMSSYKNHDGIIETQYEDDGSDRRYLHKRIVDDGSSWLLHGHVHEDWKINGRQINVGVDQWDYKPVSVEQILTLMNEKSSEQEK